MKKCVIFHLTKLVYYDTIQDGIPVMAAIDNVSKRGFPTCFQYFTSDKSGVKSVTVNTHHISNQA